MMTVYCRNGHAFRIARELHGKEASCPVCGFSVSVPSLNGAEPVVHVCMEGKEDLARVPQQPVSKSASLPANGPDTIFLELSDDPAS